MHRIILFAIAIGVALTMSGCAVVNPYKGSFSCPNYDKGKCTSVKNAYEEDIGTRPKTTLATMSAPTGATDTGGEYQKEVYGKLSALLRQPKTPIVSAPKVMRVLMLPYKGENNELYMARYVYLQVDDPKWVMGEYLMGDLPGGEDEN